MGGGTTLVEGSRLGMQMIGNDLNPVAWFVVKQELANVDLEEVKRLLADIEAEVKPQIMPYYYCDGPNGEKGKWTHVPTKRVMPADFDPLSLTPAQRSEYSYEGPEVIHTFWAKHGPCQVTGCGHRTPIMTSPVMAVKTLSVKHWEHSCSKCGREFHVEGDVARMAPDVPLYVAPSEYPFSVLDRKKGVVCPHCGHTALVNLGKSKNKKIELRLLVHPQWLAGSAKHDANGQPFGGSAQDDSTSSAPWNQERASKIRLLEVRGELPDEVTCPETKITFKTGKEGGTVPRNSNYTCGACGTVQDVLTTVKATGKTAPMAGYAVQGYSQKAADRNDPYNGRFFLAFDDRLAAQYDAALKEWDARKDSDLRAYWPRSELPYAFMTHHLQGGVPDHPLVQEELGRWRSMPPEDVGIAVSGDVEEPVLLSLWMVEASAGNGERRVVVQPIAVKQDGTRVPAVERQCERYLQAPATSPKFVPEQRLDLFARAVEPTLQRELKHKGAANGDGSYSAELIGYVEIAG
jgi:DNA-directed RNA polymerase subunit RPC12/RpoP